jgi:hypothetical protein
MGAEVGVKAPPPPPPPPPPPKGAAARRPPKASSSVGQAVSAVVGSAALGPEAAAATAALEVAKVGGAKVKEFLDFHNLEWEKTFSRGKGSKARIYKVHGAVSRGDWLGLGLLFLGAESMLMFSHALAGLNPTSWAEDVANAVASEVSTVETALGVKKVSIAPASSQPTSVAAALSYHGLRANAKYQAWKANRSGGNP